MVDISAAKEICLSNVQISTQTCTYTVYTETHYIHTAEKNNTFCFHWQPNIEKSTHHLKYNSTSCTVINKLWSSLSLHQYTAIHWHMNTHEHTHKHTWYWCTHYTWSILTVQSGYLSSGKISKYLFARAIGRSVCSCMLVQRRTNLKRCSNRGRATRSIA